MFFRKKGFPVQILHSKDCFFLVSKIFSCFYFYEFNKHLKF